MIHSFGSSHNDRIVSSLTEHQEVTHTIPMSSPKDGASVKMTRTVRVVELPDRLWSADETATFLRIDAKTLYQLNTYGTGPRYYKVGRVCRYDPREILNWLESKASRPAEVAA
jgi:predicted DNA-binding transcriptional regulator AlpA